MPGWRTLLLTAHVVATVGLFGTDRVLLTLGISGVLEADPRTIYPAAATIGTVVLAPLALTSLAPGPAPGGHDALEPHEVLAGIKLAIRIALTPVVILFLVPRLDAGGTVGP